MATIQEASPAPWRIKLVPASFASVQYHVEQQSRTGGRRVVTHEYPKRDTPFSEDMGRQTTHYQITAYLIGPRYHTVKQQLMSALDKGTGALVDPYLGGTKQCICERYSVSETRERGGYCTFEMSFVELGVSGNAIEQVDSKTTLQNGAVKAGEDAASNVNSFGAGNSESAVFDNSGGTVTIGEPVIGGQ
jgi:prophage DNA circulation protein